MKLKIPSKTFLIGEYGVLNGGPSLVINSEPFFEVQESEVSVGFSDFFKKIIPDKNLSFKDPWESRGGFGASSAQYIACQKIKDPSFSVKSENIKEMISQYKSFLNSKASGHDFAAQAQFKEGIFWVDPDYNEIQELNVSLDGYSFILQKTNIKIPTHTHLEQLNLEDLDLREIVTQAKEGLENNNILQLVAAIEEQNRILSEANLICDETLNLLEKIKEFSVVSKGCGALGADVVFSVVESENKDAFLKSSSHLVFESIIYGDIK